MADIIGNIVLIFVLSFWFYV